jgi:hypothetical protein
MKRIVSRYCHPRLGLLIGWLLLHLRFGISRR